MKEAWFPVTPEKQALQRPGNAQSENPVNQPGEEDWCNLLGVYSEVLRNDKPDMVFDCGVSPETPFNTLQPNPEPGGMTLSLERWSSGAAAAPLEDNPVGGYTGLCIVQQESNQELGMLQQCTRPEPSFGRVPRQKVRSLAELLEATGTVPGSYSNVPSHPHVELDEAAHTLVGAQVDQRLNHGALDASYHLQEMTSSSHSCSYPGAYDLNLAASFGGETSSIPASQALGPTVSHVERQLGIGNLIQVPQQLVPWGCIQEAHEQNSPVLTKKVLVSETLGPATPDVQQKQPQNVAQVPQLISSGCTQEDHEQNNATSSRQDEIVEQHDRMLTNVVVSTTAVSSSDEKNNLQSGSAGIDLNKTPQQKPPRRKKYLPKVVVEGKPKRTPKSTTVKTNTPGGDLPAKRSHVRKNGIKTPLPGTEDAERADGISAKKSCRRALNFDLDESTERIRKGEERSIQAEKTKGGMYPVSLNEEQSTTGSEVKQMSTAFAHSARKISFQDLGTTAEKPAERNLSSNDNAQSFSTQNILINQVHQGMSTGLALHFTPTNAYKEQADNERRPWLQCMPQYQKDILTEAENQCLKRPYANTGIRKPQTTPCVSPEFVLHGVPEVQQCNSTYIPWQSGSGVARKRHVDDKCHGASPSHLGIAHYEHFVQTERQVKNNFRAPGTAESTSDGLNPSCSSSNIFPELQQQRHVSSQQLYVQQMRQNMIEQISTAKDIYPGEMTRWNPKCTSETGVKHTSADASSSDRVAGKKRAAGQTSSKKASTSAIRQKESVNNKSYGTSSKGTGSQKQRDLLTPDDLADCLKRLDINNSNSKKDEYALVPYGADGAIIPHEGHDPIKRRFPRPKVDLDQETNRLWNLLMGKEGSGSAETMDKDKQKWWEEERRVFRGRIDSFIARMHLVQGDRRFSKWKGSVVDSVVGVFLTQNVSDHLSSSAFMCLAARFPQKTKNGSQPWQAAEASSSAHHNNTPLDYPNQATTDHQANGELTCTQSSVTTAESFDKDAHAGRQKENFSTNSYLARTEDDVVSSQSSSGSLFFNASKDVRSSSGSNSEAEEGCIFSGNLIPENTEGGALIQQDKFQSNESLLVHNKTPLNGGKNQLETTVQRQSAEHANIRNTFLNPFMSKVSHDQAIPLQSNTLQCMPMGTSAATFLEKQSLCSLASTTFEDRDGVIIEGSNTKMLQVEGTSAVIVSGGREFNSSQEDSGIQKSYNYRSKDEDFQLRIMQKQVAQEEKTLHMNPIRLVQTENWERQGNMVSVQTKKPNSKDDRQAYQLTEQPSNSNLAPSKTASQKTVKAAETSNWDTLRTQAELKYGTKERSWEAVDSLDYEALRNASVHIISDTIKERGMNNMLAERIKDFLDRLVQDHGRVDLEWLRDVPPDKVKDYLLSIRGLGLKSVECVRLLTLQHLAFPVDTNVGRIAVRLGWVPLQPLPESLQLHLLELYPVLETIQKYLWPRLCNLDQETLYELHYQMITFGKVFCTKRDPNCNACPMRGECRHFASAYASARLALPGPQERQLINLSHPPITNKLPDKSTNPLLLPSSVDNTELKPETPRICEPVIEEPTTPELPTTVLEQDIEDAFYDDPDEIPVIELNVKAFATNLQSFIQENMAIAEADMSKALVALSPEIASLPVPKLKHVSRLRTEHQVYELPDSHPLLDGMDKREPDDPSPYLLAIWSPGETADSVQPPENKCRSQELGELCFDNTCFACNSKREAQALTVRGTILIPCRTAMRGSFPLNGTYFQVNEIFADHASSLKPIDLSRSLIWKLPRRTVFFGTSVSSIFKGLSTEAIQHCFWRGFVCVRGFDQQSRAPRPLMARLHFPDHFIFHIKLSSAP